MSNKIITLALVASTLVTTAFAQQASAPAINQRAINRVERRFNITPAQIEQARTILLQEQPKLQQLRQSLVAERSEMAAASTSGSFDPTTAHAVAAKYADVNADAAVERAKLRTELLAILTPEQKQKLEQLRGRLASAFGSQMPGLDNPLGDALGGTL